MKRLAAAILAAGLVGPAWAGETAIYGGQHDTAAKVGPFFEAGVEHRFERWRWDLVPMVGAAGTDEGSFWAYGGFRYEWELSESWWLVPNFSVAVFSEGDRQDLGGTVQFRSGIEVLRAHRHGRLGLRFYHLSNGGLYTHNPGSNSLALSWAWR